ncbi:MAG: ABC transporter permease [Clostridia bacterium]|nr:ABC transporter permease [Clostridia bacterium]
MKKDKIKLNFEWIRTSVVILIALVFSLVIILLVSKEPAYALKEFLIGPIDSMRHIGNVIEMTIPLIFTGLAVSIMFSAEQFNLAAEGAFFAGAVAAAAISLLIDLPIVIHPMIAMLAGGILGTLITGIPAYLKVKWNASELVSSLMFNYIALYMGLYVINYFFRDVNAGAMVSERLPKSVLLLNIIPRTRIHFGLFIAILFVVATYYFMFRSKWGYALRVTGQNSRFAEYSGINTLKVFLYAQLLGGFIAGVGGATELLGMYKRFSWQGLPNIGWDGVIVAILARNNPVYVPFAALFLAYLRIGADIMARMSDVQNEVVSLIQGIIIVLVVAERFLAKYKHKWVYKEAKTSISEAGEE